MQATSTRAVPGKEDEGLPRVLLIEDDPDDADIVSQVLGKAKVATVETARSAEDGLRIFRKAEWDLVLLDYRLPGSSGLDALDRMRKIDADVPMIVLTGTGNDQIAADAIRLGANEYLSKDDVLTVLPTAVRTFLEVKRADARRLALLKDTEREEELKAVTEAGKWILQSVPADSPDFDGKQPASARSELVTAFAQLYRAVRTYSGGLPGVELIELCRVAGDHHLSARQIAEIHVQAMDEVIRDEWSPRADLASRLHEGLLLALLWLNDSGRKGG